MSSLSTVRKMTGVLMPLRIGRVALLEMLERRHAAAEAHDLKAFIDEIEAERFPEGIVIVNEDDPCSQPDRRGAR